MTGPAYPNSASTVPSQYQIARATGTPPGTPDGHPVHVPDWAGVSLPLVEVIEADRERRLVHTYFRKLRRGTALSWLDMCPSN